MAEEGKAVKAVVLDSGLRRVILLRDGAAAELLGNGVHLANIKRDD